jgi:ribose-phosphate pyrophosphokinase
MKAYEKVKYPDGGAYCKLKVDEVYPYSYITEKINSYEDLFFLASIVDVYRNNGAKNIELTIPCMFQQQHDRRFNKNESFELKLVCDFINSLNLDKVSVFHPHSECSLFGLNRSEVIDGKVFYLNALHRIIGDYDRDNFVALSPDAGAFKWIYKMCQDVGFEGEIYTASKQRDHETKKLTSVIQKEDFGGKDIIIFDDLCVFGGTFINLAKLLKQRNIGKLYLVVSHITVKSPNPELESLFEKIYTTNSKFEQEEYSLKNLEVINFF